MAFFTDTYFSKINPLMFKLVGADAGPAQLQIVDTIAHLLETEIEPLLPVVAERDGNRDSDAGPYFGGAHELTVVEVSSSPPHANLHRVHAVAVAS
jgi:hypothetical protein